MKTTHKRIITTVLLTGLLGTSLISVSAQSNTNSDAKDETATTERGNRNQVSQEAREQIKSLSEEGIRVRELSETEISDLIEAGKLPEDFTLICDNGEGMRSGIGSNLSEEDKLQVEALHDEGIYIQDLSDSEIQELIDEEE